MKNPGEAMHQLAEQLNSLTQMFGNGFFDQLQAGFNAMKPPPTGAAPPGRTGPGQANAVEPPPLELYVTPDEAVLSAVLPGLKTPGQVSVSLVSPTQVVLEAFLVPPGDLGTLVQRERFSGYCTRMVTLPVSVLPANAGARYEDGILEVRFRRAEPGKGGEGVVLLHVTPPAP